MFSRFIREEKGQGAIEYILVLSGIIITIIIIFGVYSRMATSAGNKIEKAVNPVSQSMQDTIESAF